MTIVMNLGWIITFAADGSAPPQISVATEGGSGTPVPDLSVEVDDFSQVHRRMLAAGFRIEYGLSEPWGVTRFYVRDPFGRLVNILAHATANPKP
jgi:catechol 2,3-dioxygenase-like lactoylglutathione lyase family enzyme